MPSNRALEWAEITDFAPGLFSGSDWLMPPTAAQVMADCHPEIGGGLRAAFKPTVYPTTGLDQTQSYVCGLFTRGAIGLRSGIGDASDRYIWAHDTATNQVRVYRWDETAAVATWSLIKTHAAPASFATPNPVQAATFVDAAGDAYVVYNLAQTSADDGLWSIKYSDGSVAKRLGSIFPIALAVQDDRIMVSDRYNLRFSASQSISSFPAPNVLPVQASRQGNDINSITPFAPGDLLIGTRFSAWTLVQGDITDPTVRTMSDAHTLAWGQSAVFTEGGLAFIAPNQGIYLTSTGESFEGIGDQIDRTVWVQAPTIPANGDVGGGNLAYVAPFLMAPHGYIFDFLTKSWFQSSVLDSPEGHYHSVADNNYRSLFAATGSDAYRLYVFDAKEGTRCGTYTWKSAPLHRPDGRQVEMREIQVYAKGFEAGASITITVNGTSKSQYFAGAGKQQFTFKFSERAEVLDVQIVATTLTAGVEAPSVEVLRIGSQSRHTLL